MSNAADRVHEFRLTKGLAQDEFAEKCGLSRSIAGRYEVGVVIPSFDTLQMFEFIINNLNKRME